jgi:hypothetical protein
MAEISMSTIDSFEIKIGESCSSENYGPPDDPLCELTPLELGLRRFCYDQNHRVLIRIGDQQFDVFLFPDISLLICRLPDKLRDLAHGATTELEFPESMVNLELSPKNGYTACTIHWFGPRKECKQFTLDPHSTIEVLHQFLEGVLSAAISAGYITAEDASGLLTKRTDVA